MKKCFSLLIGLMLLVPAACQKQQSEEEKNAEIERRVQERLAAEHQADQQKALAQREADLDAREKALADKEKAAPAETAPPAEESENNYPSRPTERTDRAPARGYSMFYNKLEPYGDWIEAGDYGYVFHPRESDNSRWRPYTNGRWVYTDAGWTWISQEPFGWATYHYGRWTRLRGIGWVWVPGNQWAPAWVSWRTSNDYVGWAPLPPEARFDQRTGIRNWADNYYDIGPDQYCFVASREFGAPQVERTVLPPERNVTIVTQTTNVTNITYNNTTIVNEGPNYDELRAASREPVQRFRLERNVNVESGEPPRAEVQGEKVVIAAPVIAATQVNARPSSVKQTVAEVSVDLGWNGIANQDEAKKARQKIKSEATPPPNVPPKKFTRAAIAGTPPPQSGESVVRSDTPAGTSTPIASAAASASATPLQTPTTTPRRMAMPKASLAPSSTSTPTPLTTTSPTPSQRRGRLLLPSTTPTPRPSLTPTATPEPKAPPFTEPMSTPTAPPQMKRGKTKGQPQQRRTPQSESTAAATAASSPAHSSETAGQREGKKPSIPSPSASAKTTPASAPTSSVSSSPKLTKEEKKEQKREEKKELKRERRQAASPSPTP